MIDLAIIGGGPAGYVAAQRAGAAGLSVVLFEMKSLGGVCLNEGCIPTKTLLYSAKTYDNALHAERYGVKLENPSFCYEDIVARKDKVIKKLVAGIKASMKAHGVTVAAAQAVIKGKEGNTIRIEADGNEYEAENLLICTGSQAVIPPIPGLKEAGDVIVTNREILALREQPKELIIIGGGVIGMEFAAFYNTLGTRVTVIEMLPKILGPIDEEISAMLQKMYSKRGIEFQLGCKVKSIDGNEVLYEDGNGEQKRLAGEKILVSTGRRAVLTGFGLENLDIQTARGIVVDERMRTSMEGVYAAGDVTGFSMLAHTASREGEVAVADILARRAAGAEPASQIMGTAVSAGGIDPAAMSYTAIPGVVYTNPEVACVGLNEEQAAAQGIEVQVLKLPMAFSGRFVAENERGEGLCKIVACKHSHKVLGVSMIGNPCSEIIQSACIAIEQGMSVEQLREVVFPHPSVSEILKETAWQI